MFFGRKKSRQEQSNSNKDTMRKELIAILGADNIQKLEELIETEKAIPPKVAVIGKAGVGKTTTINNLFNANYNISHIYAGTKDVQQDNYELFGGGTLTVFDMPGLEEDIDADEKYLPIYQRVLSQVDVVLYVMQANAKSMSADQKILRSVVSTATEEQKKRIVIGLNQVDKIPPSNWNTRLNLPSHEQKISIERRCDDIIEKLSQEVSISHDSIVYYSALKHYRLYDLLIAIIKAADNLGWKFPIQPKDPFELADPEVREFIAQERAKQALDEK